MASNDTVRESLAGHRFHHLWAARRCLRMVDPNYPVSSVFIEGSPEPNKKGELVIDVSETWLQPEGKAWLKYYQLKHSSRRIHEHFPPSELENTLQGFGERFREQLNDHDSPFSGCTFYFVSNRRVSPTFKQAIDSYSRGESISNVNREKLEKFTSLSGKQLKDFCSRLRFKDAEGNYLEQERELKSEISQYWAGTTDDSITLSIAALVSHHALPTTPGEREKGEIVREHVLKRLGVTHERDLFPAPSEVEPVDKYFKREQHEEISQIIERNRVKIVIHATGGIGKTVVAKQLASSFPVGSESVIYDCFGGGNYLNESEPRHRPCDAFPQIANELASRGLCQVLVSDPSVSREAIYRSFLSRIESACCLIAERDSSARLIILIDAADNAEMAAKQKDDNCFVSGIIREPVPENCRIVFLCRSERRELLQQPESVQEVELMPFNKLETLSLLEARFSAATEDDAEEFRRLTVGNPRVQANFLDTAGDDLRNFLDSLGSSATSSDDQIGRILDRAITKLKYSYPKSETVQIESICKGLATLPPFIPIRVLASVAGASDESVKSFVADFGRSLRQTDDSVQFRDEPTETWFKQRFASDVEEFESYAAALQPLASSNTYAARCLPALWKKAGRYSDLISLALSDELLPESNPADATDVRVYRLQFALKAAIQSERWSDAAKLAMRAGEEMAGNQRVVELFSENTDLVSHLMSEHQVQELAYKREIKGSWHGSETIYSASLLSSYPDFFGDSRNYFFSAEHWIRIFSDEIRSRTDEMGFSGPAISSSDSVEFGWAGLRLFGPEKCIQLINMWKPHSAIYETSRGIVERLIDFGDFESIENLALGGKDSPCLILGVCDELVTVAKFPPKHCLRLTFNHLFEHTIHHNSTRWEQGDTLTGAQVSFLEACAHHGFSKRKILKILKRDWVLPSPYQLTSDYNSYERQIFVRAIALKHFLIGDEQPAAETILPIRKGKEDERQRDGEIEAAREIISVMIPFYWERIKSLCDNDRSDCALLIDLRKGARKGPDHYDLSPALHFVWAELPLVMIQTLAFHLQVSSGDFDEIKSLTAGGNSHGRALRTIIQGVRIAYRHEHLESLAESIEAGCKEAIQDLDATDPTGTSSMWSGIARSVLSISRDDASSYFGKAIESSSQFGDEFKNQWEAICAYAGRVSKADTTTRELAYRFIRVGELVGELIGREKYWDRNNVFRLSVKIHAPSAISGLCRWRDRQIGWTEKQSQALVLELLKSDSITPKFAFALTGFEGLHASREILKLCVEKATGKSCKQTIFDLGVRDMFREGKLDELYENLSEFVEEKGLQRNLLTKLSDDCASVRSTVSPPVKNSPSRPVVQRRLNTEEKALGKIVEGLVVSTDPLEHASLSSALLALKENNLFSKRDDFWEAIFNNVSRGAERKFLATIKGVEGLDYFDVPTIIRIARSRWGRRAVFDEVWPDFLEEIGRRFFSSLAGGGIEYWEQSIAIESLEVEHIENGIRTGVAEASTLLGSDSLFGFAKAIAVKVEGEEAADVLHYGLRRSENSVPENFGDGEFEDWLIPPDLASSTSGIVWSALGAPDSKIRWEAAHCVSRMVVMGCLEELTSLFGWVDRKESETASFQGKGFPFYRLHAVHFLLVGLNRGAQENPGCLTAFIKTILQIALNSVPHVLIQLEAASLALRVNSSGHSKLSKKTIRSLRAVGRTSFPTRKSEDSELFEIPLDGIADLPQSNFPSFGIDFRPYWIERLSSVFGISNEDTEIIVRNAIRDFVLEESMEQHDSDPRNVVWRNNHLLGERSTYHSHGSYPDIHDYSFYAAYHGLMIAAAKLFEIMPVLKSEYEDEHRNKWETWLESHLITRRDGRWVSDRRDSTLPSREKFEAGPGKWSEEWIQGLTSKDFADVVRNRATVDNGLCVSGSWHDADSGSEEVVNIECAFVRCEMANSLANSLRSPENHYWVRLKSLLKDTDLIYGVPFDLRSFVEYSEYPEKGLDNDDPYARKLSYPPEGLSESIASEFQLNSDREKTEWKKPGSSEAVVKIEAWSNIPSREGPNSFGERIIVAMSFLAEICQVWNRELLIAVEIRRYKGERSYQENDNNSSPFRREFFRFTRDGKLKKNQ